MDILTKARHIRVAKLVAVFGFVLACATLTVGARYFAMIVFATGVYACNSVILGRAAATCGQTKEKRSVSLAMVNTIASVSAIYSSVSFSLLTQGRELTGSTVLLARIYGTTIYPGYDNQRGYVISCSSSCMA